MEIRDGIVGAIGGTPLIKLRRLSEATGCTLLGKAEFLNPGGSVKDRTALFLLRDAEERGAIKPGGVVVEGTAGNTGVGLALVGNARGYRTVIVIPQTQSQEKKDLLQLAGDAIVGALGDDLAAIAPGGRNTWTAVFPNPATATVQKYGLRETLTPQFRESAFPLFSLSTTSRFGTSGLK